jgi:nitroreductase
MHDILKLIQERRSLRLPFDPQHRIAPGDLRRILEAGRWAPTAHNMQNFEIVVVDDPKLLEAIGSVHGAVSEEFVRENYEQLSFSEEELKKRKTGLLGTMFPPAMRSPNAQIDQATQDRMASFQGGLVKMCAALFVVLYDPARRAPASEGDFLGIISLGCALENMWLVAESLGIGLHVLSVLSADPVEAEVKRLLAVPEHLKVAISFRLGYPLAPPPAWLRVRRDIEDFSHHNCYGRKDID